MPGLQEIVYKLELGEGAKTVRVITALLVLVALTVWYDLREYRNFHTAEAMEAAQLARNLSRGMGFTTHCIRPLSIYLVESKQGVNGRLSRRPHPDLVNPPVYPLLLAGLMKVIPLNYDFEPSADRYQPEVRIAVFNQLLLFLAAGLTFWLVKRLFDLSVAAFTATAILGSDLLWKFSISGLPTLLLMVMGAGLAWALVLLDSAAGENKRSTAWFAGWALVAGVLVGLGGLTRYAFGWMILPTVVFCAVCLGTRRVLVCGLVLAGFLAVMTPWIARNYQQSGTFFGVAGFALQQETAEFPDHRLERSLNPDLSRIELEEYVRKLLVNGAQILTDELPKYGGSWLSAFFLVGLFLPFRNPTLGRLRWFTAGSVVVLGVAQALGHTHLSTDSPVVNSENLLILLTPLVFAFGSGFLFVLLDQLSPALAQARRFVIGFCALVACSGLILTLLPPRVYSMVYPPYYPPWIQESGRLLNENELMMSDMPWAVAWYGGRPCVWTTWEAQRSFFAINDEHKAISALYLTPLTTDARFLTQMARGEGWDWARLARDVLLKTNLPPRFPLRDARSGYLPDQLLLCDRPRWKESGK